MRCRADHVICVVAAIASAPCSARADARPRGEANPLPYRTADTGIDIVRMPPPPPRTAAPVLPPSLPVRPPPEIAQPQARRIKLTVNVGSLPTDNQKAWVGIKFDAVDAPLAAVLGLENAHGALVLETTPSSPASQAGLQPGDVVVAFAGTAVQNVADLRQALQTAFPGRAAVVDLWRVAANGDDFLQTLRRSAERGDANIMYRLGRMYATGIGVTRDEAEAVQWHRRAAAAGNTDAMAALAIMVLHGRGTTKDIQEGLRLLRAAADKNNLEATYQLGQLLSEGKLVNQDALEAARLFTKGAELGHVPSMVDIGVMYFNGTGVKADPNKAVVWFQRAADLGHASAMVNLGLAYAQGKGIETDFVKAGMWFKRAADLGHPGGMVDLGVLHAQGKGVERNDVAAVALYRKAVSSGNVAGMNNLAWMLESGRGVERKDPEQAADLIMKSLDQRDESSRRQMTQNHRAWSKEFRQAVQRRLRDAGFSPGPVDGQFRESTIASINAYFNRNR